MVSLNWTNKRDFSIDSLRKKYFNKFIKFGSHPRDLLGENEREWKNQLYWGDSIEASLHLLNDFREKINLIYIDPPFFSGSDYHIEISENGNKYNRLAYNDDWKGNLDSYLQMLFERINVFYKLLANDGLFFLHLDYHAYHYVKIILDEIFGRNRFVNDIVWYYYNKYSAGKNNLPRAHDNILVYSKSNRYTFNEVRIPREKPRKQLKRIMINGVLKNLKDESGHVQYRTVTDKKLDDVWKIPCLQPASKEWTGFPTQKHHALIERIIQIGSNEEDIVADFFCGSGTTLLLAEKTRRKWLGCDVSPYSIYLTRKRLINYLSSKDIQKERYNPIIFYSQAIKDNLSLIKSGFFEKDIEIKRM